MCLAVPGKILNINGEYPLEVAEVDFLGVKRNVYVSTVNAHIGDYVIVHAGTALSIINKQDALSTIHDLLLMTNE